MMPSSDFDPLGDFLNTPLGSALIEGIGLFALTGNPLAGLGGFAVGLRDSTAIEDKKEEIDQIEAQMDAAFQPLIDRQEELGNSFPTLIAGGKRLGLPNSTGPTIDLDRLFRNRARVPLEFFQKGLQGGGTITLPQGI